MQARAGTQGDEQKMGLEEADPQEELWVPFSGVTESSRENHRVIENYHERAQSGEGEQAPSSSR